MILDTIVAVIQQKKPHFFPKIGIVLGSGLGDMADLIADATRIPYADIPGFPQSSVSGHKGQLVLGILGQMPVACMQGRVHAYEGAKGEVFRLIIRTLKQLGCEIVLLTNASGSLREDVSEGHLCLISDHINFQHENPLTGANDDIFGPRFFAMTNAYDKKLNQRFLSVASELGIPLAEGVYGGVTGPCFETPAEIRAFRAMGADLIGMSTIPEVIVARHCGLRVAAIASVTNLAAGMREEDLSHEGTLHMANLAALNLSKLIISFLESLYNAPC